MQRGVDLEFEALELYSTMKDVEIDIVGFIEHSPYVGCSPDGLIGMNGGIEIKCPNDNNFIKTVVSSYFESKYIWQCQMNLYITGREYWDLAFYNPNFDYKIHVTRILPNKESFAKIEGGISKGIKLIQENIDILNNFFSGGVNVR